MTDPSVLAREQAQAIAELEARCERQRLAFINHDAELAALRLQATEAQQQVESWKILADKANERAYDFEAVRARLEVERDEAREAFKEMRDAAVEWESQLHVAEAQIAALREALTSIANNSCCDRCQEAALVARQALSVTAVAGTVDEGTAPQCAQKSFSSTTSSVAPSPGTTTKTP
jgi:hypothetical protein